MDKAIGEEKFCKSSDWKLNLLDLSLTSHTEIHDQSVNDEVIASRTTRLGILGAKTRTDFFARQPDGTVKHYEEFPTPLSSLNPAKANLTGPMHEYDPKTDKRGKAIAPDSDEQVIAHNALVALREKFTPAVILKLPSCP